MGRRYPFPRFARSWFVPPGALILFLARTLLPAPACGAPRDDLRSAQSQVADGRYNTALPLVDALISRNLLQGDDLRDAYVLKALCELQVGTDDAALDAFCGALKIDPTWRTNPDVNTPDEVEAFQRARSRCPPEMTVIQFGRPGYSIAEGSTISVQVSRFGSTARNNAVTLRLSGTATPAADYNVTEGLGAGNLLTFAPGDSLKSITLSILKDKDLEPAETILFSLLNPTGAATIGEISSTAVTLLDASAPERPAGSPNAYLPPRSRPIFTKPAFLAPAAAVAGGVIYLLTKSGPTKEEPLPSYPEPPK